jgi:phosphoglycerate dehydrogenase-like enzyme
MSKKRVLITGHRFYLPRHTRLLRSAGFAVSHFEPDGKSDRELAHALAGHQGYLWGGMERVTAAVLADAKTLAAVSFPGSGYTEIFPALDTLTRRGVALAAAVGVNSSSVAEHAVSLMLAMLRVIPFLAVSAEAEAPPLAHELSALTLGVVGFGHTGRRVAELGARLNMSVLAVGRATPRDLPSGVTASTLAEAVRISDVVSLHVDSIHGRHVLGQREVAMMKRDALLVNVAFPEAVDLNALYSALLSRRLRAAFDSPPTPRFARLPEGRFIAFSDGVAFDTVESNLRIADRATKSLINLMTTGDDVGLVNPGYRRHRSTAPTSES